MTDLTIDGQILGVYYKFRNVANRSSINSSGVMSELGGWGDRNELVMEIAKLRKHGLIVPSRTSNLSCSITDDGVSFFLYNKKCDGSDLSEDDSAVDRGEVYLDKTNTAPATKAAGRIPDSKMTDVAKAKREKVAPTKIKRQMPLSSTLAAACEASVAKSPKIEVKVTKPAPSLPPAIKAVIKKVSTLSAEMMIHADNQRSAEISKEDKKPTVVILGDPAAGMKGLDQVRNQKASAESTFVATVTARLAASEADQDSTRDALSAIEIQMHIIESHQNAINNAMGIVKSQLRVVRSSQPTRDSLK